MICKNCNENIADNSNFCNYCGFRVEQNKPWHRLICEDEKLWNRRIFEEAPSLIAHEYYRTYRLMEENKTYGAMMQIKDLLEVIVKLPVVIEMARIYAKEDRNIEDLLFLSDLLKQPGLGDWRTALIKMCNRKEHIFEYRFINDLKELFTTTYKFGTEKFDVVHWRNQTIGHGALAFDSDEQFRSEFKGLLTLITKHFNKWEAVYTNMKFYLESSNKIVFKGKDATSVCCDDNSYIYFENDKGVRLPLYPFLILWENQFYIYDALVYLQQKYDVLCYPIGRKLHFKNTRLQKDIEDIYNYCSNVLKREKSVSSQASAEDGVFLVNYEDYISNYDENLHEMKMLDDWFKEGIKQTKDKIFLLMMERGMGKTSWVRNISKGKILENDVLVKPIYLNDTYRSTKESIVSKIDQVMTTDRNHAVVFDDSSNRHIRMDAKDLKEEIANFCAYYLELYKKEKGIEKIVLVLDGIDEVLLDNNNNIFSCIPDSDMLPEHFYILITCRDSENISDYLNVWLNELKIPENNKLVLYRDDMNYRQVLTEYIKAAGISESDTIEILNKSEYRFAYVNILTKILLRTDAEKRASVLNGGNIMNVYLEMIEDNYLMKHRSYLYDILYMISISPEPLTVKELSFLLGDEKISFALLGILNDLKGILRYERTNKKNRISIANQLYKESILQILTRKDAEVDNRFNQAIADLVSDIYTEFVLNNKEITGEGQGYLLLHLNYFYSEDISQYVDFDLFVRIFNLAERYIKLYSKDDTERGYKMLENADKLDFDVSRYSCGDPIKEGIIKSYIHMVLQYKLVYRWKDLFIYVNVPEILEEVLDICINIFNYYEHEKEPDQFIQKMVENTIIIYYNALTEFASFYYVTGVYELAEKFLQIVEANVEEIKTFNPGCLIKLYQILYGIHSSSGEKEKANKYLKKYAELESEVQDEKYLGILSPAFQEELLKQTDPRKMDEMVFKKISELEERLENYDGNSYDYYNICEQESALLFVMVKINGSKYLEHDDYLGFLDLMNKINEVRTNLARRDFPLMPDTNINISYLAGSSYLKLGLYDEAIHEFNLLQTELDKTGKISSIIKESEVNTLFLKYIVNMGLSACCAFGSQNYEKAVNYLVRAAEIYDENRDIINIRYSPEKDILLQIAGLYNAIYANSREKNEDSLNLLRELFYMRSNADFDKVIKNYTWENQYIKIDRKNNTFLRCANGATPRAFIFSEGYYDIDFKRICNSCRYKDCIGYKKSGKIRIKK